MLRDEVTEPVGLAIGQVASACWSNRRSVVIGCVVLMAD